MIIENPDIELDIERDPDGLVTRIAYKVNHTDEDGHTRVEFLTIVGQVFEGPLSKEILDNLIGSTKEDK